MKFSKAIFTFLLPLWLFLAGCESIKNITDPLADDKEENKDTKNKTNAANESNEAKVDQINLYFVRPADPLTIGQDVELYVDDDEVGELSYSTKIQTKVKPGTYELATKVGWSLSLPVTGLGGACKFEGDYKFSEENYYFKIVFDPGLLCGEHEIIGIVESEYSKLAAGVD
jgi:hypothetical protein|tara:strand:- start:13 stop:525 length:513 start_codon:yes stop_codon:yes gene_type:complete